MIHSRFLVICNRMCCMNGHRGEHFVGILRFVGGNWTSTGSGSDHREGGLCCPVACTSTGGCSFIGSCFVLQQMQQEPDLHLINLDALAYAGNLDNVKQAPDDSRYTFVQADLADRLEHDRSYAQNGATVHTAICWTAEASFGQRVCDCPTWNLGDKCTL